MLVAFPFEAKPGKEAEFERLLNNPDAGGAVAKLLGATRNTFPQGRAHRARPRVPRGLHPALDGPRRESQSRGRRVPAEAGPLLREGFDLDEPGSIEAFNARAVVPLAYDVRV